MSASVTRVERWGQLVELINQAINSRPDSPDNLRLAVTVANIPDLLLDTEIHDFVAFFVDSWGHAITLGGSPEKFELELRDARRLRREEEREEQQERAKDDYRHNLANLLPTGSPKDLVDKVAEVTREFERIVGGSSAVIESITIGEWTEQLSKVKDDRGFPMKVFGGVPVRRGNVGYIGSRTSRGKSTVGATLDREVIESGRSLLHITAEESGCQSLERLVLNLFRNFYLHTKAPFRYFDPSEWPPWTLDDRGHPDSRRVLAAALTDPKIQNDHAEILRKSFGIVKQVIDNGRLRVVDVRNHSLERVLATIRAHETDVTILDYIQRLPAPESFQTQTRQVQIQQISSQLCATVAAANTVGIAMAQFTRNSRSSELGYDVFDDASFREAGDIEQDAYVAIGIGQEEEKRTRERYYRVLKARESNPGDGHMRLGFDGAFSIMWPTDEPWRAPKTKTSNADSARPERNKRSERTVNSF